MTVEQDDQNLYDDVGAAFGNVYALQDAEAVVARGRVLRRRRRAVPALVTACVVATATAIGLTVVGGSASNSAAGPTVRASVVPINVDNANFSVHTDSKTGFVTISLYRLDSAQALRKVLADGGIASYFYTGTVTPVPGKTFCSWVGAKEESSKAAFVSVEMDADTITIDPAKMPPGSALGFQDVEFTSPASGPDYSGVAGAGEFVLLSAEPTDCTY